MNHPIATALPRVLRDASYSVRNVLSRTDVAITSLALVHHANQYLITNGYDNREGIADIVGSEEGGTGMLGVLAMHRQYDVPLNLHISGTLLESIAWHSPDAVRRIREFVGSGLVELIGSSYGQNIMRFFSPEYNRRQLNEELALYESLLCVSPVEVKVFWPPERVWETRRMAPVLRDAKLLNEGYRFVILDDRTFLSPRDPALPRRLFDTQEHWTPEVFRSHEIENGLGLIAFPIATRLRRSIPPKQDEDWECVQNELEALLVHSTDMGEGDLLAVYADDMEKVIGVWGADGPPRYAAFLAWLRASTWIRAVKLTEWSCANPATARRRKIETGTFARTGTPNSTLEKDTTTGSTPSIRLPIGVISVGRAARETRQGGRRRLGLIELAEKQLTHYLIGRRRGTLRYRRSRRP